MSRLLRNVASHTLTAQRLRELLSYNKRTGVFRWRATHNRSAKKGEIAGYVDPKGYRVIHMEGTHFLAHRLAWLHVYGEWPKNDLDHRNRNKDNNWIKNLRQATHAQNKQNIVRSGRKKRVGSLMGCHWDRRLRKFRAVITVDSKRKYLGVFSDEKAAHAAYITAKRILHPFGEIAQQ